MDMVSAKLRFVIKGKGSMLSATAPQRDGEKVVCVTEKTAPIFGMMFTQLSENLRPNTLFSLTK